MTDYKCPKCGAGREAVRVEIKLACSFVDGTDNLTSDGDWFACPEDITNCAECDHFGTLSDFTIPDDEEDD